MAVAAWERVGTRLVDLSHISAFRDWLLPAGHGNDGAVAPMRFRNREMEYGDDIDKEKGANVRNNK